MNKKLWAITIVAALGYFVDIYDLILFNAIKKESLDLFHLSKELTKQYEISLLNFQMLGMMIGGVLWGILGDKKGRIVVLFGSILLYSIANILNAFVTDLETYRWLRLIAGIGLAGELGAGITLVSETISKEKRGIGTMIIVTFGALGGVAAALVGNKGYLLNSLFHTHLQNWQIAYIIGGVMGLLLLLLRTASFESELFKTIDPSVSKGNFLQLFRNQKLLKTYLNCIFIGIPIWFMVGILMSLAPRFSLYNSGMEVKVSICVMWTYVGLSTGDILSGYLSQLLKSRKIVIYIDLVLSFIVSMVFLFAKNQSEDFYYFMSFALGFSTGYWALFVLNGAEQFGTNLRSTVTTSIPNFVRGTIIPVSLTFQYLSTHGLNIIEAACIVGSICFILAFVGNYKIKDGFDNDMDYIHT
jgi:MFS family permease